MSSDSQRSRDVREISPEIESYLSEQPTDIWPRPPAGPARSESKVNSPAPEAGDRGLAAPIRTAVRALLLTDLIDSTKLVESLGDARAAEVSAHHDRMSRDLLVCYQGLEIDKTDGFLFLFERPVDAVAYALAYHRGLVELSHELGVELRARAGIHLGEVTLRENPPSDVARGAKPLEVEGLAKPMAARVMSLAGPRQTLLTRSAFDLSRRAAVSKESWDESLRWLAHGKYLVKGVEDPMEIFEVGVAELAPLRPPPDSEKARRAILISEEHVLGWRPAAGQPIPRRANWTLTQRLGEGGFGEVWLAAHKSGEKRVFKFCHEAERLRSLKREVTLFRLLKETLGDRDDISRIFDWSFEEPPYFLEAEHAEGGSLVEWAEEQGGLSAVPLAARLEIVARVAEALAAAHTVGVLHKDVKPENVLITPGADDAVPHVRLTDFGISRLTDDSVLRGKAFTIQGMTATDTSTSTGTRLYMAPELLEGKPETVQADVYSLGVMLYQVVVGDFRHALAPGWRRQVDDELLTEDIACFVDGDPRQRPEGAGEVARRLRHLEERRARRQADERTRRAFERSQRRRRTAVLVAAAASVLLLVVSAFAFQVSRARHQADQRRQQAEQLIDFLLGDLRQKLEPAGKLDVLEEIGNAAMEYFGTVAPEELSDQELLSRSRALYQIGDVRYRLGELESATRAFRESLRLAQSLVERDPDDEDRLFELSQSHFWVGYMLYEQGDLEAAHGDLLTYLRISEGELEKRPGDSRWQTEVISAHGNLATLARKRGDLDSAMLHLRTSADILRGVTALSPERQDAWVDLARLYDKIGLVKTALGELEDALRSLRTAIDILERHAEAEDSRHQRYLALVYTHQGIAHLHRGDPRRALESFEADLRLTQGLADLEDKDRKTRRELALSHGNVGVALLEMGELERSRNHLKRKVTILEESTRNEGGCAAWCGQLADGYLGLAWLDFAEGRFRAAAVRLEQSASTLAMPAATSEVCLALGAQLWWHGRVREALGETEAARASWSEAVATLESCDGEGGVEHRALLARLLMALGEDPRPLLEDIARSEYRRRSFLDFVRAQGFAAEFAD